MKIQERIDLFIKHEGFAPEAHEICPRFDKCSVNRCPLHKNYSKLEIKKPDNEKKCKMEKLIRKQIGVYFNLFNQGLTKRELSGTKKWESLSQEQKAIKTANLKQNSPFARLKQKGYGIVRVGKPDPKFTLSNEIETPVDSIGIAPTGEASL
jgi:hypothetical protein